MIEKKQRQSVDQRLPAVNHSERAGDLSREGNRAPNKTGRPSGLRANMSDGRHGTLQVTLGNGDTQTIDLIAEPRGLGGHQW